MQARVSISFREGVLDPEAAAIERSLAGLGFEDVRGVRRIKIIELDLATADPDEARDQVEAMCERLLANPVIESWRIEIDG